MGIAQVHGYTRVYIIIRSEGIYVLLAIVIISFCQLGYKILCILLSGLRISVVCLCFQEKYGPKGQGKASNALTARPNKNSKQQPDIDINVGLSERPPWFCRFVYIFMTFLS